MNEIEKLLKDWEQWEAELILSEKISLIDILPDNLYYTMIDLQKKRNEMLDMIGKEKVENLNRLM